MFPGPGCPNSFNVMQFLGHFGKIVCWCPPWGVGAPSSGKSWIRHRYDSMIVLSGGMYSYFFKHIVPYSCNATNFPPLYSHYVAICSYFQACCAILVRDYHVLPRACVQDTSTRTRLAGSFVYLSRYFEIVLAWFIFEIVSGLFQELKTPTKDFIEINRDTINTIKNC